MKKTIALLITLLSVSCSAQFYTLHTNITFTNYIAASSTISYSGTNSVDVSRFSFVGIAASFSGSDTNTNTASFFYVATPDGTNWETSPRFCLTITSYGTNRSADSTNIDVRNVFAIKSLYVTNSCTNSLTNAFQSITVKRFLQN